MRDNPFITICVPVHNNEWSLDLLLAHLVKIEYPKDHLRLVFVENGSTDRSYEVLQEFKKKHEEEYEGIILKKIEERGISLARNIALGYSIGFVLLLDADIIVRPDLLRVLLGHFERDRTVGCVVSPCKRDKPPLIERVTHSRLPSKYGYVDSAEFGCALSRSDIVKKVGMLNLSLGLPRNNWEALEYCARIRKAGYKVAVNTRHASVHLTRSTRAGPLNRAKKTGLLCGTYLWRFAHYYFFQVPKYLHEVVKVGLPKDIIGLAYYISLPYVTIVLSMVCGWQLALLYFILPFIYESRRGKGLRLRLTGSILTVATRILRSQGYSWMLIKRSLKRIV